MNETSPLPLLAAVALLALPFAAPAPSRAAACVLDDPPAATLLLPYFEVDLASSSGQTTLFSVGNSAATAALVNVTLWTDLGVPTLAFPVYLTGYDVETVNLRDVFEGRLPATASTGQDPTDTVSPRGDLSQDIDLNSCDGILPPQPLTASFTAELRKSHQGLASTLQGPSPRCSGAPLGDGRARGYVTMDLVKSCSTTAVFPSDNGYFGAAGRADSRNVLFGDVFTVDPANNSADGSSLVRIEAFPGRFVAGNTTFYGRFFLNGQPQYSATDDREPLAYGWATRFVNGGSFDGGTRFVVWRDPGSPSAPAACDVAQAWAVNDGIVAFDEQENVLADEGCPILCPPQPYDPNFPRVAQKVDLSEVGVPSWFGPRQPIPFEFGWAALTFSNPSRNGDPAQTWVGLELNAEGRFSVSEAGTPLDSACGTPRPLPGF